MTTTDQSPRDESEVTIKKTHLYGIVAATTVMSCLVTRKADLRIMKKFAYEKGIDHGEMEFFWMNALNFIYEENLNDKFVNYILDKNKA